MAELQESDFHTKDHRGLPMPKSGTYLRPTAVNDLVGEVEHLDKMLSDGGVPSKDANSMRKRVGNIRKKIDVQSAPKLSPEQRDVAKRREIELREDIQSSMCSQEEMRKCPSGAIGKFQRGEASPGQKAKTLEWKNVMLMLDPENHDPDLCNIETFRPKTNTLNMDDAYIPGKSHHVAPGTEASRANWDRTFGGGKPDNGEGDEIAALRAELAEMRAKIEASSVKKPSREKKVAKTRKPSSKTETMVCGKVMDGRGQRMHRRACKEGCEPMEEKG